MRADDDADGRDTEGQVVRPGLADEETGSRHEACDGEDDEERQDRDQIAEQDGVGLADGHPAIDEDLRHDDRERGHADDETADDEQDARDGSSWDADP